MRRKIAVISEHASPLAHLGGIDSGGQNVYVDQISKHLSKLGFSVDIFTRWENKKLPQVIRYQENIRIVHIEAGPKEFIAKEKLLTYMKDFYNNMLSFIEQEETPYQLIHANFFMSAEIARRVKKKLGIPFVVTFHALGKVRRLFQGRQDKFSNKRFEIEEKIIEEADHIIAECPQDREDLLTLYQADQNKISIIPCGFDPMEFYPIDKLVAKMTVGLDSNTHYLLQLGRLVPRKGIDTVVQALADIKKTVKPPVKLLIVGGESDQPDPHVTPEIARLKHLATELEVLDDVIFIGRKNRDQLKYFYNAADIFISTPWYEPFGITPLEAMACGTPVIGSKVGGIQFSVIDGKTGFLVPAKNSVALSKKIKQLIQNDSLRQQYATNGMKRVNTFFTWNTVVTALVTVYEKVLYSHASRVEEYQLLTDIVDTNFNTLQNTLQNAKEKLRFSVARASRAISQAVHNGSKILICGNGGSASDSSHFAAELVGNFKIPNRNPLPVISLTTDTSILTAVSNDFSYTDVFARQVAALGQEGDVLLAISTSGNSENILKALRVANKKNLLCIALTGRKGGKMIEFCDISLIVPSENVQHIQEVHSHLIHSLCELVELQLVHPRKIKASSSMIGMKNGESQHYQETED